MNNIQLTNINSLNVRNSSALNLLRSLSALRHNSLHTFITTLILLFTLGLGEAWAEVQFPTTTLNLKNADAIAALPWSTNNSKISAENKYYYSASEKVFVMNAFIAYQSKNKYNDTSEDYFNWIAFDSGNSSALTTAWSAPSATPFKGAPYFWGESGAFYQAKVDNITTDHENGGYYVATIQSAQRIHSYRVTNCTGASILCQGNSSRGAKLEAYEVVDGAMAQTATTSAENSHLSSFATVSITGLDGSKEYVIVVSGTAAGSNTSFAEIAFTIADSSSPTPTYTPLDDVRTATADPFGFATANNRTTAGTTAVMGGGMYDIDAIMTALGTYTAGTSKTVNGKSIIVLQSDGTSDMMSTITSAITDNDIIIFDGNGTSKDFIISSVMSMVASNKTILGINGARLCTQWYLTDADRAALDAADVKNKPTSGVGGQIGGKDIEPAEYYTRTALINTYGESEPYRNAGIFSFNSGSSNLIIRNIKFVGPGSVDVGGNDLLAFKGVTHAWVDHCEFTDGIDGNFDITNASDFITVSWNKFSYTNRSYVHQNTNLVGSSDDNAADEGKLNITFAYNQWGEGCNARMPMVRYGKIHLLNNYYTCVSNGTSTVNPRKSSEILLDGNHWISGIRKVFEPATGTSAPAAYTWNSTNVIKDANPQSGCGAPASNLGTVTVPYDYSAQILDPETLPTAMAENGGAMLYNVDSTPAGRTFVDFKVNFRNADGYQMITPAELPDGVTINGTFHDTQHGYNTTTITVPVYGPVKFTFGACGSGGNATVKNESDEVIATIDCKSGGCDTSTSFDHIATWIYNSTTPQTLTITTAQYIPFFYAEKCEFIPPVTVTYYDTDGTTIVGEPQEMEAGSALVIKYGESDVTVSSGKKFRNWRVGSVSGPKAVAGMSIAENTNLYAYASDIEQVGTTRTFNLTSPTFYPEEHDVIVSATGYSVNGQHGWDIKSTTAIVISVAGPTKIKLGQCQHAGDGVKYVVTNSGAITRAANEVGQADAKGTDGNPVEIEYTGENATTLTISATGQAYLHSIELTPIASPEPVLADVSEATTWDWSKTGVDGGVIQLTATTTPTKTEEFILSQLIPSTDNFKSDALKVIMEYPVRDNKYAQGGKIMFHTTVPGTVAVTFTNTGSSNPDRFLTVNGTKYGSGSGSGNSNAKVTTEVEVDAGDVILSGALENGDGAYLRFYKIVFTPNSTPTPEYPKTANWDFKNEIPSTISSVNIQGTTGTVASNIANIELNVDATVTNGKFAASSNTSGKFAQFNTGTIIQVPVTSKYDVVNVEAFPGQAKYTVGGVAATDNVEHNVSEAEATAGYVVIVATGNGYINSISVIQQGAGYVPTVDWTPTWDSTNNYWIVKKSATDDATENAKGFTEALKHLAVESNVAGKNKTLFIPNGTYDLGTAHNTSIPAGMHLIGESQDGVLIKNQPTEESINATATFQIDGANVTLENMTIKCRAPYGITTGGVASNAERGVCVQDCGNGTNYIKVTLDGLQDTYYSNGTAGMTATFDNCIVRGNVDFFCGNGNITVNNSRLQIVTTHGSGGTAIICAPATYTTEAQGYLFDNCIVEAATSDVDCVTSGHSSNLKFNLARAWYAGGSSTEGKDRTPRVTFKDTEFEIAQNADWGGSIGYAQAEERREFQIVNTGIQFSDMALIIEKTNKPFAYVTANDRTNPERVNASNINGGGVYDIADAMAMLPDGYEHNKQYTTNGKNIIVLSSDGETDMHATVESAIKDNDIIIFDGNNNTDFVIKDYIVLRAMEKKSMFGINGARLCTQWYMTPRFKNLLDNVQTSSGTGVNSASTAEGTGGSFIGEGGKTVTIKEEGEFLTRKTLFEATGNEDYRNAGLFYIAGCNDFIIRNLKFVGPGSIDVGGYDLMAIIDNGTYETSTPSHHIWVDHCEFTDGIDGNFDITNKSDFITVSWCKFSYTDRSYAHQNTNLVGSDDSKTLDDGKLNITFAYNEWGAGCRARMPMARYGRIHMLNNLYSCVGNSEAAMNPRIKSEFLIEGNYFAKGVRNTYKMSDATAVTWSDNNKIMDMAGTAGTNVGSRVTVPYQYAVLDPLKVTDAIVLNGGAVLYNAPVFTTDLPDAHTAKLSKTLEDGIIFSVWADHAHTFQWYKAAPAEAGSEPEWTIIEGANRNSYTYMPTKGETVLLKCLAIGVSGQAYSNTLALTINGESKPIYTLDLDDTKAHTAYSGSPIILNVEADGADSYQWYKTTNADGSNATKITDATSSSYSYEPTAAEIVYLFCRATNQQGNTDSKIVKVKGVYRNIKFHMYGYFVQEENDGNGKNHIATSGGTTTTANGCDGENTKCTISENAANNYPGLCFQTGKNDGCNHNNFVAGTYAKFSPTSAIATGDVITIKITQSGSDSPNDNYGFYLCTEGTKTEENLVKTISVPNTVSKGLLEVTLTESEITKLAGKNDFYLIPFVPNYNKKLCINEVLVYNGELIPADDPVVTTDVEETKSGKIGTPITSTIVVTDAASYQWYKNTTNEKIVDDEHKIEGATSATLTYTPTVAGKEYIYCVIQGVKQGTSVSTSVMELTVKDGNAYEAGTAELSWPMIANDAISLAPKGIIVEGDFNSPTDVITSQEDVSFGSKLTKGSTKDNKFTGEEGKWAQFVPTETLSSEKLGINNDAYLAYKFTTKTEFTPKNVSFKIGVDGTNEGCFKAVLKYGAEEKVIQDVTAMTNNAAVPVPAFSIDITDVVADPNSDITLYLYLGGKITNQKSIIVKDVVVSGEYLNAPANKCALPTATKGEWDAENEKWKYTLTTATESAKIHYTIGNGEEQVVERGAIIKVSPGESFSVWAVDTNDNSDTKLSNSKILTDKGAAKPVLATPIVSVSNYNIETKKFTVTISGIEDGATAYYTTDGSTPTVSSTAYSNSFSVDPETVVKVVAIKEHYVNSAVVSNTMLAVTSGSAEIVSNKIKNSDGNLVGASFTMNSVYSGGNPNVFPDGCKLNPRDVTSDPYKDDALVALGITSGSRITINPGFVVTKIVFEADNNYDPKTAGNESVVSKVFIDGDKDHNMIDGNKTVPYDGKIAENPLFVVENIAAMHTIDFGFTGKQINTRITLYYEFNETPSAVTITNSGNSEDVIELSNVEMAAFLASPYTYSVSSNKVYAEDPIVKITTNKGNEYIVPAGNIDEGGEKYTNFQKSFLGINYTVKAKVNAIKSPNINIEPEFSLAGGHAVQLSAIDGSVTPYIKIDNSDWVVYDPTKTYYALKTIQAKVAYTENDESKETQPRTATCPSNEFTPGKPFAVFVRTANYMDTNNDGAQTYNDESVRLDKIHQGLEDNFNVIDCVADNKLEILSVRPDINSAKLVVITETIGGSGSTDIEGVGTKSNPLALTLKRDVVNKTNVLNFKMYTYSSSANNELRWAWAQPYTMPSNAVKIKPLSTSYMVFQDAAISGDGYITLWDNIETDVEINHLQPVFNYNEENLEKEGIEFISLAKAVDPADEEMTFDILHYFNHKDSNGKTDATYVGFGLSVNEWKKYNDNVKAIVSRIGSMIIEGKELNSAIEGVVDPKIADNGDGSATITNNNGNTTTYYLAVPKGTTAPERSAIIAAGTQPNAKANTIKYTTDQTIYAVSELGGSYSNVVSAEVKGSLIRYITRISDEKDGAIGQEARYPFTVNEDGTAKAFNFPYNQSWSKPGYTVTEWIELDDEGKDTGKRHYPGELCNEISQDVTVKAVWTKNSHVLTDLCEEEEAKRTVTWEFLPSKGAPEVAIESREGLMSATIVGQAFFIARDEEGSVKKDANGNTIYDYIDVPLAISTDNMTELPDNGTEYHGKFNNISTNYADLTVGGTEYKGSDYAQVRTGTQFTFPVVYGSKIVYKQIDLVEADKVTGEANGNVNRSQISQSILSDGKAEYTLTNPGYKLDTNGKVVFENGAAKLNGEGNYAIGGIFNYTGEATTATLTSRESAQYIAVGENTGKTLGDLNYGSCFMQYLAITYPSLYELNYTVEASDLKGADREPQATAIITTPAKANCDGKYVAGEKVDITIKPAYGYEIGLTDTSDTNPEDDIDDSYTFLKYILDNAAVVNRTATSATVNMEMQNEPFTIALKRLVTYGYKTEAYPGTYGSVVFNTYTDSGKDYEEFPEGATIVMTAKPAMGYQFDHWEKDRERGIIWKANGDNTANEQVFRDGITAPDGVVETPDGLILEDNQLKIVVRAENSLEYVEDKELQLMYSAIFKEAVVGTTHYELAKALIQEGNTLTPTTLDASGTKGFDTEVTRNMLLVPKYYTLYKEGYTLDHWVEHQTDADGTLLYEDDGTTPLYGRRYNIGTSYYFSEAKNWAYLIPVFVKNDVDFKYRATDVDITWDFRRNEYAQYMNFGKNENNIYYSTHATINATAESPNGVTMDVPLKFTTGKKGTLNNSGDDEWCLIGHGTEIDLPSGYGATFWIASYSELTTTTIGGVSMSSLANPTRLTDINDNEYYLYEYTTDKYDTDIKMIVGSDYTYFKYIRAKLPSADKVTLKTSVNNPAFGKIILANATTTDGDNITNAVNATRTDEGTYTLGLGTTVTLQADRERLYVVDYFEDITGKKYYPNDSQFSEPTGDGADKRKLLFTFQMQSYVDSIHAVYKLNDLWQINYTSGEEAEGEAPGIVLIERGDAFTVPAENHYLYLEGQTLKYWVDENGKRYDFGQSYTPTSDLFLSPVFEVNDFTVLNITEEATALWPLTRIKKGTSDILKGNGDVTIYYQKSSGVYVTPLKLSNGKFIDLKIDINAVSGKVDNRTYPDRCQVNSGTTFNIPSSSNCDIYLYTTNNGTFSTTKIDGTKLTSTPVSGADGCQEAHYKYDGDASQLLTEFTGDAPYLCAVKATYHPVTTTLPDLDYITVGNIALGAVGTAYENLSIKNLKKNGKVTINVDLSTSTTGELPVVKAEADNGGIVTVNQATLDNTTATILVKTPDEVTVRVYKVEFNITAYPDVEPRIVDLLVDRKYQCDLNKMDAHKDDPDVAAGTTYIYDTEKQQYLITIPNVSINGTISIKFNNKMKAVTVTNMTGVDGKEPLNQDLTSDEGQTLTFTYRNLELDTEYDFIIPAGTFHDVYYMDNGTDKYKAKHSYMKPIRLHFTTTHTAVNVEHRLPNFVVTHNQASKFNTGTLKMEITGERIQVATDDLIANLEAAGIPHGTIDEGIAAANKHGDASRFYIFVPDGDYQMMGNEPIKEVKSASPAAAGNDGKPVNEVNGQKNVYNGITAIAHDNISITGQSMDKTKLWNRPYFEGMTYTSTIYLKNGTSNFYAQDLTLENRFDYRECIKSSSNARATVIWDRSSKPIFKNVGLKSYTYTIYTNSSNQTDDTRGYYENCDIYGYSSVISGDGDHWFENCNLIMRQGNGSTAGTFCYPRQYDVQDLGYVLNGCTIKAEDDVAMSINEGKFAIAQPWNNSPALTILRTNFDMSSIREGYKAMSESGHLLRIHEYSSFDADGKLMDLSQRSLRSSSPAAGSFDAVMTPSQAASYNLQTSMGGTDGYDPSLYTRQCATPKAFLDDQSMIWDEDPEALCYYVFYANAGDSDEQKEWKLFTITNETSLNISSKAYRNKAFCIRSANQRGGLSPYSNYVVYEDLGEYDLAVTEIYKNDDSEFGGMAWSTICLPFGASVPDGALDNAGNIDTDTKITVYAVTKVNALDLHLSKVTHIDPKVGYVVYATKNRTYRFLGSTYPAEHKTSLNGYAPDYKLVPDESTSKKGDSILVPSDVKLNREMANVNCYTLDYKTAFGIGFYKFNGEMLKPYRAWLDADLVPEETISTNPQARLRFIFDDDDENFPDGIQDVFADGGERTGIFDLMGNRVMRKDQLRKGQIYIINGKKTTIK